jgi:hypothetical protein
VLQVLTTAAPLDRTKVIEGGLDAQKAPKQLTRRLLSKPAGVSSLSGARRSTPALLTNVDRAPKRPTTVLTAASHCSAGSHPGR